MWKVVTTVTGQIGRVTLTVGTCLKSLADAFCYWQFLRDFAVILLAFKLVRFQTFPKIVHRNVYFSCIYFFTERCNVVAASQRPSSTVTSIFRSFNFYVALRFKTFGDKMTNVKA